MSLTTEEVDICNQAIDKIGGNRFTFTVQTGVEALRCIAHYEQTRDALLRSHYWRFASARAALAQDTNDPDFEYDNQFKLPEDFLRLKSFYDDNAPSNKIRYPFVIEGQRLLTDESTCEIRYIAKITDATKFDPLFTEVLILLLSLKLLGPLAGGGTKLAEDIRKELKPLMSQVRALDRQETNTEGRELTWNEARRTRGGRIDSRLGSA